MGQSLTTINDVWKGMENKLISGPQLAFKLQKSEKTVLVFGEDHKSNVECGKNEERFTDLFKKVIIRKKCEKTNVILELTDKDYNILLEMMNINECPLTGRLSLLCWTYIRDYPKNKDCDIRMDFGNPYDFNLQIIRIINEFKKSKKVSIENKNYIGRILFIFKVKQDLVHIQLETLPEYLQDEIYKNILSHMYNLADDILKYISHGSITIETLDKLFRLSLGLIDVYCVILIYKAGNNTMLYSGSFHSLSIVLYLIENGYSLKDVAFSKKKNCISVTNSDDINIKLMSIISIFKNYEDKNTAKYCLDIISKIQSKI